ncbi:LysR family transcriptional regulator [Jatrophihabitans sp.]|uniref:LysR family transcriptional regulator n=1 Tax=Jatrophihabitans sp. TaxID=1932789 RepID=UPI0030C75C25|nr:LysR family transcriptional regulator [Jatrophihabitans sp.]
MPELSALEVLLAVARTGSLNAAGRELGISQQAVSSRIASTEALTGVALVTRTTHGSSLTAAGTVVAQWADRLLQVAGEVDAGLAALRHDRRSRLRVSASLTIAEHLLPGWLVSLQIAAARRGERAADVVLTAANSETVLEQVRSGAAELGFVEGPQRPKGLHSSVIAHDHLRLVVLPEHRWARRAGRRVTAAELLATAIVSREAGSGTRDALAAGLRSALGPDAVQVEPALELSTTASVRGAVLAGAGPAVLSELAVGDDLAAGRLVAIDIEGVTLLRELRAVWAGARTPPSGAARELLSHIGRARS